MKTLEELKAFCEGFRVGSIGFLVDMSSTDAWVVWGGYDINFVGAEYSGSVEGDELLAVVYPAGWEGELPDHLHSFVIKGE